MRLKLLFEAVLPYEEFIKQPNWINTLVYNYKTRQRLLTAPLPAPANQLDDDTDYFGGGNTSIIYFDGFTTQQSDHLVLAIVNKTRNAQLACNYTIGAHHGRWPAVEHIIKQDPEATYYYALDVMDKVRWPAGEPAILTDPLWSHRYARDIIRARWPEAEATIIMTDPEAANMYAKQMIGGRWLEAEESIRRDPEIWLDYNIWTKRRNRQT